MPIDEHLDLITVREYMGASSLLLFIMLEKLKQQHELTK